MDDDFHANEKSSSDSSPDGGSTLYTNAFFPSSQHFVIAGGVFTSNITKNIHRDARTSPDFRRIPLGDIDLRKEIPLENRSWGLNRRGEQGCVRRMYSARVRGARSPMTVALYHGEDAAEKWLEDISRSSSIRHPNFVQIFAGSTSACIHAIVAHDDLIPFNDFLNLYQHLPVLTVYIHAYTDAEFEDATEYLGSTLNEELDQFTYTFWIRRATRRLCVDLIPSDNRAPYFYMEGRISTPGHIFPFNDLNVEPAIIASLGVGQYHRLCSLYLRQHRDLDLSASAHTELNLAAVVWCPPGSEFNDSVGIAYVTDLDIKSRGWFTHHAVVVEVMKDGWIRYNSCDVPKGTIYFAVTLRERESWLSQANHIFSRLQITTNYEEYVLIDHICFRLGFSALTEKPPEGYLFICPTADLKTGPTSFKKPVCPAYWSLSPSGTNRLSADEAILLGFPAIQFTIEIRGQSWNSSVYAGLRKFHHGKGFDPESQEVARHLNHPLYKLFGGMEAPSVYVEGGLSDAEMESESYSTSQDGSTIEKEETRSQTDEETQEVHSLEPTELPSAWICGIIEFVKFAVILLLAIVSLSEQAAKHV